MRTRPYARDAPAGASPLWAVLGGGPPTLPHYFLNPRHTILKSEVPYYLHCGEFRMPLPYHGYADSRRGPSIQAPAHPPLRVVVLCGLLATAPQHVQRTPFTQPVLCSQSRPDLPHHDSRVLLEDG